MTRPTRKYKSKARYVVTFGERRKPSGAGRRTLIFDKDAGRLVPIGSAPRRRLVQTSGVSENASVMPNQVKAAQRDMEMAGVNVKFDAKGRLHYPNRSEFLKALKVRGLHNKDEVRG